MNVRTESKILVGIRSLKPALLSAILIAGALSGWRSTIRTETGIREQLRAHKNLAVLAVNRKYAKTLSTNSNRIGLTATLLPLVFIIRRRRNNPVITSQPKKLKEVEKLFKMFFEQFPRSVFLCLLDEPIEWNDTIDKEKMLDFILDHERITRVNQAMLVQYGVEKDESIIGTTIRELLQDDPDHGREKIRDLFDRGYCQLQIREQGQDRTSAICNGHYSCLYDEQARIIGHFGIQFDTTENSINHRELRESEEKFRFLVNHSHDLIWRMQPDGVFSYVSPSWKALLGYEPSYMTGKAFQPFVHTEDIVTCKNYIKKVLATGHSLPGPRYRVRHADGTWRWHEGHITPVYTQNNDFKYIVGVSRDITQQKQREDFTKLREEILQVLNDSEGLHSSIRRILFSLKNYTGFDAVGLRLQHEEDFPFTAQEGFPEDFLLTENSLIERDTQGGICRDADGWPSLECTCGLVLSGKTDPDNKLFTPAGSAYTNDSFLLLEKSPDQDPRHHPRNQCIYQGYASIALIPIRATGQIMGLLQLNDRRKNCFNPEILANLEGIAAHIGSALRRMQVEQEIKQTRDEYQSLVNHLPGVAFRCKFDADWTMLFISQGIASLSGYPSCDFIQNTVRTYQSVVHPDDRNYLAKNVNKAVAAEQSWDLEYRICHRNGDIHWVHCRGRGVSAEDGSGTYLDGVIFDITERKQAEEEREELQKQLIQTQKIESVGRLAGGVAHDFNNMLQAIMGHAEMALDKVDPAQPFVADLQEIHKVASRSRDLTRQLLTFARKQTVSPRKLDLNQALENILKMLRRLIDEDIQLQWNPGENLAPINMDPPQIDQIMANLCVNARDAITGAGKITIETSMVRFDTAWCSNHTGVTPGEYVLLAVSDDGCGMDQETIGHLFEPFFTTKEVGKGTGLGLASVYGAIKQNNGFINVYSEPGRGTTFRIYLPRYQAEPQIKALKTTTKSQTAEGVTILLVEDESSILYMASEMLERLGYTVIAAQTPDEAIRLAHEHSGTIELLITDVVMPGMNGRELAERLLSTYPKIKRLFMSGYTANVIVHHGVLEKDLNYIAKPFSVNELKDKLRTVLES